MVKVAPRSPPMTPSSMAGANMITFTGMAFPTCGKRAQVQTPVRVPSCSQHAAQKWHRVHTGTTHICTFK